MKVCCNTEPSTYGHECGKPAEWLGDEIFGFCDHCKNNGHERTGIKNWSKVERQPNDVVHTLTVNGKTSSREWLGKHWGPWSAWA